MTNLIFPIIIILLAFAFFIFKNKNKQSQEYSKELKKSIEVNSELSTKNNKNIKEKPKTILITILAVTLGIFLLTFFMVKKSGNHDNSNSFPFAAIWPAIFIPIIANKNKKGIINKKWKDLDPKVKKIKLIIVFALGILMLLGITTFLLMNK